MEIHLHLGGDAVPRSEATPPVTPRDLLQRDLEAARNQTSQADFKASLLGSGLFAGGAVLFASGAAVDLRSAAEVLAWTAAAGVLFVLTALGIAVWPRWGSMQWSAAEDPAAILGAAKLKADDEDRHLESLAAEVALVNRIAHWKFWWLRVSVMGSAVVIALVGAMAVSTAVS